MKNLLNLMMIILLFTIVGCPSDDNEGTFELPTKSVTETTEAGVSDETGFTTGSATDSGVTNDFGISLVINGTAAGYHIIEPATIVAIDGSGSNFSSNVDSNGNFAFTGQSLTAPFILFLVPGDPSHLNWQGDVQARIVTNTASGSFNVNPITTAVALSIFNESGFDLWAFAQATIEDSADTSELLLQFNSLLSSTDDAKLNETLQAIMATWGTSSGENIFASSIFDSYDYTPRKSMRNSASLDHLLIEALGVKFGTTNLGQSLANHANTGSNLLSDKGFQEGLVFILYSLNKYQPFAFYSVNSILNQYLSIPSSSILYESRLQDIVDDLVFDEIGFDKSEDEIKAKIKSIIATQNIIF